MITSQSNSFAGAADGYMGEVGQVAKGSQFARAQVAGRADALLLGGFLPPGRTVSAACLAELVGLVEAELGRPRRRVEAVAARVAQVEQALAALDAALAQPPGAGRRAARRLAPRARLDAELAQWRTYHATLVAEHATNPSPRRILLRLDGGFGDAAHLAWRYEQGYDVVARAHRHQVATRLRQEADATPLAWEKISKNGFIAESRQTTLGACPSPLPGAPWAIACRQWRGEGQPERWSALIVTPGLAAREWPVRRVGTFSNQRQGVEATIKQGKGVLASRHLPTRHQAGIALYQELVLLAQHLLRWFRRQALAGTALARLGLKALVHVGARGRALLVRGGERVVLEFATDGPWPGIRLPLCPGLSDQLWFPFLEDHHLAPASP